MAKTEEHADIRLYLVVHESLRLTLRRFVDTTDRLDPATLASVIGERWALFARALHVHHEHEDDEFFPLIGSADPSVKPLIEQLEREHQELIVLLNAVDADVAAL